MNEPKNHTTKADFVEALNGQQTASTHDQLSLDVEPAKTFKKGHKLLLTDYGVQCIIARYRQTENVTSAAEAAGISYQTLNRILRRPKHANHAALAPHLPTPRRNATPEYLATEKEIARVLQGMQKVGAANIVLMHLLRNINFQTSSGKWARDMSDQSLLLYCYEFISNYHFGWPVADESDQVKPDELPSSDFALSASGDLILRLAEQLTEFYYQAKQVVKAIDDNNRDRAAHYANDLKNMLYKAMTDAKQEN